MSFIASILSAIIDVIVFIVEAIVQVVETIVHLIMILQSVKKMNPKNILPILVLIGLNLKIPLTPQMMKLVYII